MIWQFSRKTKLNAILHDGSFDTAATKELAEILESKDSYDFIHSPKVLSDHEVAGFLAKAPKLDRQTYSELLDYLNNTGSNYSSVYPNSCYAAIHHSRQSIFLAPAAHSLRYFCSNGRNYHTKESRESSSHIYYYIPGGESTTSTGCITDILQIPLEGVIRTFFAVNKHQALPSRERHWNPYSKPPCLVLQADLVCQQLSSYFYIIEPQHIICHLVVHKLDRDNYPNIYKKIRKSVMAISWSLDRRRRGP